MSERERSRSTTDNRGRSPERHACKKEKRKHKKKSKTRSTSSSSSSTSGPTLKKKRRSKSRKSRSSSSSSSWSSSSSTCRERKNKKEKKKKRKKKKKKKEKKKFKKSSKLECSTSDDAVIGPCVSNADKEANLQANDTSKRSMKPMTKEEWEKQQSVIRRVYDPETGRTRLVKGDGEILEEIVSRERHKEINKQATMGDGTYFQTKIGLNKNI